MSFTHLPVNPNNDELINLKQCYDSIFDIIIDSEGLIEQNNLKK